MTLGKHPQPLSRRQARELARGDAPEASADTPTHPSAIDVPKSAAPRRAGTRAVTAAGDAPQLSTAETETVESAESVPSNTAPSATTFAPRSSEAGSADTAESSDPAPSARTLSRRELRALNIAEAADSRELEAEAVEETDADKGRPGGLNPPVGHWSVEKTDDAPEAEQPFDQLMALGIGAGAKPTSTNALVLPSIPNQDATSGPLTSTGETLITGSFDLPRSLGATGQHPNHFDSSDMDHMLDQLDEGPTSSSAPVSASRAVSTHTSTRGVMTPPKKHGTSRNTILVVSTAALAVSVLGLFLAGYLFQIF